MDEVGLKPYEIALAPQQSVERAAARLVVAALDRGGVACGTYRGVRLAAGPGTTVGVVRRMYFEELARRRLP